VRRTFYATLTADDGVNPTVSAAAAVRLRNVAPSLSLTEPRPWQVFRAGAPVSLTASFTDPGSNDTHGCAVAWDDGTAQSFAPANMSCDASHTFHPSRHVHDQRHGDRR
jgi:hypothetical protein